MRKILSVIMLFGLSALVLGDDERPKPKAEKKSIEAFTDPAKAGRDFALQGEYQGEIGGNKIGAQVVSQGDGEFYVKGLLGGLPGDGWDGQSVREFKGKLENEKVTFGNERAQGTI